MIKKLGIFITLALLLPFVSIAQEKTDDGGLVGTDDTQVIYSKERMGGIIFHSSGWGLNFKWGKNKGALKKRLIGLELVGMKHPKEYKSFNPYYEDSKGYFYGKQNAFYIFRPTFGQRHVLFEKIRKRGVEVNYVWALGPSVGLTKPVYLEIGHPAIPYEYISVEKYDSNEHYIDNIFGKAPVTRGLGELKMHPGIHAKFGFNFEYSPKNRGIKAIETGMTFDAYAEEVPIMALVDNQQFFFAFYINLLYGKKYFR